MKNLEYVIADDLAPESGEPDKLKFLKEDVLAELEPKNSYSSLDLQDGQLKGVLADYQRLKRLYQDGEVRLDNILTSCNEVEYMTNDHFSPGEDSDSSYLHISTFSCNHYTTGKQIFAHEIGHAISAQFFRKEISKKSRKKYMDHRECITGNYKDKEFSGSSLYQDNVFPGDSKYSEEDMADFVSSIVYNNPQEKLLNCDLLSRSKNNIDYDKNKISVLNKVEEDTHSSAFLRTLKEAIFKNKILTPSCRGIIEKYKDRINFNKCGFE